MLHDMRTSVPGAAKLAVLGLWMALLAAGCGPRERTAERTARVTTGPLRVWVAYEGKLESRTVHTLMSSLGGSATITALAPEGARVEQGAEVVRLDSSRIERDLVRLEGQFAGARSEYESLKNAEWPLKLGDLERQMGEARAAADAEQQYLADTRALLKEDLVTPQEVRQQESKAEQARAKADQLATQLQLTRQYVEPLALEQARAKLTAAEQELALARRLARKPKGG